MLTVALVVCLKPLNSSAVINKPLPIRVGLAFYKCSLKQSIVLYINVVAMATKPLDLQIAYTSKSSPVDTNSFTIPMDTIVDRLSAEKTSSVYVGDKTLGITRR